MAADPKYSGSTSGTRVAALLNAETMLALDDYTDLRSTVTFTPFDAAGSASLQNPIVTGSYGMTAPAEGAAVSATGLTQSSFDLDVARYSLRIDPSDLWQMTGPDGGLNVAGVAEIIAMNAAVQFTDMLCALVPSLTTAVGTTGTALTVTTVLAAAGAVREANSSGRRVAVLHHQQFTEFQESLRAEVGPLQWVQPSAELLEAKGPGFQGVWQNIEFYSVDSINAVNADADWAGCLYGPEAFRYTEGPVGKVLPEIDRKIARADSSMFVTQVFDDVTGSFRIVGNYFPAVSIAQNLAGVKIISQKV